MIDKYGCFFLFKIESIESILQEKETQLKEARVKIESKDSDNKILSLEESLVEKERQIEKYLYKIYRPTADQTPILSTLHPLVNLFENSIWFVLYLTGI